jgi:hypothetical protein
MFKRTGARYQFGSLQKKPRKNGPDVWVLRYRVPMPDERSQLKSKTVGTVAQYPTKALAPRCANAECRRFGCPETLDFKSR